MTEQQQAEECYRHKLIVQANKAADIQRLDDKQRKILIYETARNYICTCTPRIIWCVQCRGKGFCHICCDLTTGDSKTLDNQKYCSSCGGTGKCFYCSGHGDGIAGPGQ